MKQFLVFFGTIIFIGSLSFYMGKAYELNKFEARVNILETKMVNENANNYFVDSCQQWLGAAKLDIPNEISQLTWYDDKNIDLLFGYIDDAGDVHIGFTGKQIPRDSLHLDEIDLSNHSELKSDTHKITLPTKNVHKPRHKYYGFEKDI